MRRAIATLPPGGGMMGLKPTSPAATRAPDETEGRRAGYRPTAPESRTAKRLRLILVMTMALWAGPARAGMEFPGFTTEVATYSCRELLALDEARENIALLYLSGYVDGQRQVVRFDGKRKAEAIIKVLEHCRTSPESSVLKTLLNVTP